MTSSPAFPASTIVLLRPAAGLLETLLLQRARGSAFLGGAHVFPGGRVDPDDGDAQWRSMCDGLPALERRLTGHLGTVEILAHAVAAIREVFEEAGLLLGTLGTTLGHVEEAHMLATGRTALLEGQVTFAEWCRQHGVRLSLDVLHPWAHWITPETEPKRFDTWFFLAGVRLGVETSVIHGELVEGRWMRVEDALRAYEHRELILAPPTMRTLEEIVRLTSIERLAETAAARSLAPVLPTVMRTDASVFLVLPGDPHYRPDEPAGVEGPTRFVFRDKRWISTA